MGTCDALRVLFRFVLTERAQSLFLWYFRWFSFCNVRSQRANVFLGGAPFFVSGGVDQGPLCTRLPTRMVPLDYHCPMVLSVGVQGRIVPYFFKQILSNGGGVCGVFAFGVFLRQFRLFRDRFTEATPDHPGVSRGRLALGFEGSKVGWVFVFCFSKFVGNVAFLFLVDFGHFRGAIIRLYRSTRVVEIARLPCLLGVVCDR